MLSSRVEYSERVGFKFDRSTFIVEKYTNAHICSNEDILTDNIDPTISNGVSTIGGKYLIPKGIGTVIWYWTNDEGKMHTNKLNNAIYFPDSPFNIPRAT